MVIGVVLISCYRTHEYEIIGKWLKDGDEKDIQFVKMFE